MTFGTYKAGFLQNLIPKNNNGHLGKPYVHPKMFSVPVANEIHENLSSISQCLYARSLSCPRAF